MSDPALRSPRDILEVTNKSTESSANSSGTDIGVTNDTSTVIPIDKYLRQGARSQQLFPGQRISDWQAPIVDAICQYLKLPQGWDSYRGQPLKLETGMYAIELLSDVMRGGVPIPQVVPVATGGVQLEWHLPNFDLEIYVAAPYRCEVTYEDHASGEADDLPVTLDLSPLAPLIRRLTQPGR